MPTKTATLPPDILISDCKYPEHDDMAYEAGDHGQLTFYNTTAFGWCIATLLISRSTRGTSDRTYAIRISDGAGVRIGLGPHVTNTVSIYLRKSRLEALKKYTDLYIKGSVKANTTRDRISSRRAEGVEKRAAGLRSWRWDV
jgi:hypothetical protein